jgi:ankyrin repeat protein
MNINRRRFVVSAMASAAAASLASLQAQAAVSEPTETAPPKPTPQDRVRRTHDLAVVKEFVSAAHRDLEKVKEMVAQDPRLVFAAVDTGNVGIGDWETGLNGAAHTGRRDIALFLLSQGARIDAFCAAMLGYRDVVLALLKADPRTAIIQGPHNLTLLYHAAIGGDVAIAEAIKPLLPADAPDFNQSLSAAARDGRLEMTKWLLKNGVTNVNAHDGFRKTPLKIASEKGYHDVASVLRENGGRETI